MPDRIQKNKTQVPLDPPVEDSDDRDEGGHSHLYLGEDEEIEENEK